MADSASSWLGGVEHLLFIGSITHPAELPRPDLAATIRAPFTVPSEWNEHFLANVALDCIKRSFNALLPVPVIGFVGASVITEILV